MNIIEAIKEKSKNRELQTEDICREIDAFVSDVRKEISNTDVFIENGKYPGVVGEC